MIEAKYLVVNWQSKSHNNRTIHEKLAARFDNNARACSSVTNWLWRLHLGTDICNPGIHPGKTSHGLFTKLSAFPFHNVRTLARPLRISRSMIWDHLRKGSFVLRHLRWVPHRLEDEIKRVRGTMASALLQHLQQARHHG
jgi:hypothetical protein